MTSHLPEIFVFFSLILLFSLIFVDMMIIHIIIVLVLSISTILTQYLKKSPSLKHHG
jgi:hypothetical protein